MSSISQELSNLLKLKRPRITWTDEESQKEREDSIVSKRLKFEGEGMDWEVDEEVLQECEDMAEEAGLTTPPTST